MEADIRYLLEQGKTLFKNQSYKKAESVFLKIIAEDKAFADVYNMLGIIYHQSGQFGRAIEVFEKALKINPNYTEALLNLSVLYNDFGEYKRAKTLVERSKKLSKKGEDAIDPFVKAKLANKHAEVGNLYRGVGLYAQASVEFIKALEFAPHFQDIRNCLGICLREGGQKKEALKEFARIVKEKPHYAEAQIQLGITYYSLGQMNLARKIWQKMAKSDPKNKLVRTYLRLSENTTKTKADKVAVRRAK